MACKQSIPAVISCKRPSQRGQVRARSLAAALTLGAGIALSAVTAAASSATAQELEWAKSAGGASQDDGTSIATDPRGNSYVTGFFSGAATFGAGEANETVLLETNQSDQTFVAKYAGNGALLWATSAGGVGTGIATDPRGNSYVTGAFFERATFGAGEANETVLEAAGGGGEDIDLFVAKYARDGSLLWATNVGARSDEKNSPPRGTIATDPRGNSYVTGTFRDSATFGVGEANETVLEAAGGGSDYDVFVAKYAPEGTLLWATSAAGAGSDDFGIGIATDPSGNSYVTGEFFGTATFGAGEANETVLEAGASSDVFVAKYAPDGTLVWATSAGGPGHDVGRGIATDPSGHSYVTGDFRDTATFGAGEANETVLEAEDSGPFPAPHVFVAKYARDGSLLWATSVGARSDDNGSLPRGTIATDPRGNSYVTGSFRDTATFGAAKPTRPCLRPRIFPENDAKCLFPRVDFRNTRP